MYPDRDNDFNSLLVPKRGEKKKEKKVVVIGSIKLHYRKSDVKQTKYPPQKKKTREQNTDDFVELHTSKASEKRGRDRFRYGKKYIRECGKISKMKRKKAY